jgi:mRNA-degrading endonuclease RelE of RelBE toxin-antitoxin system
LPEVRIEASTRRGLKRLPREVAYLVGSRDSGEAGEGSLPGERLRLPASLRGLYCFKLRRGDYRLIYCYIPSLPSPDSVYIIAVEHRDEIYEKFLDEQDERDSSQFPSNLLKGYNRTGRGLR